MRFPTMIATIAAGLITAAPAYAVTVDFSFSGLDYSLAGPQNNFIPPTWTVTGTASGLMYSGNTPSTDVTFTITSVSPFEPQGAVGATGTGQYSFIEFQTQDGNVTGMISTINGNAAGLNVTLSDNSTLYLYGPNYTGGGGDELSGYDTYLIASSGFFTAESTAIPAPAALSLFIPALAGLGIARRRA